MNALLAWCVRGGYPCTCIHTRNTKTPQATPNNHNPACYDHTNEGGTQQTCSRLKQIDIQRITYSLMLYL